MKNLFAPIKIALLAEKKGFNEPILGVFTDKKGSLISGFGKTVPKGFIKAPTHQQIVDWLREKHSIDIIPCHTYRLEKGFHQFEISNFKGEQPFFFSSKNRIEALNQAILKALTMI